MIKNDIKHREREAKTLQNTPYHLQQSLYLEHFIKSDIKASQNIHVASHTHCQGLSGNL